MDRYRNCKWGPCLECKLAICAMNGGVCKARYARIVELRRKRLTIQMIATTVDVTPRTVYRALAKQRRS